jgi:hypothetical protein
MVIECNKCFEVSVPGNMLGYVYTLDAEAAIVLACTAFGQPQTWGVDEFTVKQMTPGTITDGNEIIRVTI